MTSATGQSFVRDVLQVFDNLNGPQPGFRPAHAKGILLAGTFTPAAGAAQLTKAPHIQRNSTPVSVRFSDSSGIPNIPDNNSNSNPKGIAIRFHLAEHVHTDIIGHSVDGFPARTAEEFLELLRAIQASGPDAPKPSPIETFLASHPAALRFVQTPKPIPVSFLMECYFSVNAYKFTNGDGVARFARYRIQPGSGGAQYLDEATAAAASADFLFDEIRQRLSSGPATMSISVQIAADSDTVDDATVRWPQDRARMEFGTIELTHEVPNDEAEQRHIIFDPIPRVDGIDASADPLLEARAAIYLASGRRRRAQAASATTSGPAR